jgi:hypothetical protein
VSGLPFLNRSTVLYLDYRAAKKYSRQGISNAHQLLHKEMYVSCVTFSFYPDPDTGVIGVVW